MKRPIQPITKVNGEFRFEQNGIVRFLLDTSKNTLDDLHKMNFEQSDWEQFAQLIGYSINGFSELPYVTDRTWERVQEKLRYRGK